MARPERAGAAHSSVTYRGLRDWIEQVAKIDHFYVSQLAYFLEKLAATLPGLGKDARLAKEARRHTGDELQVRGEDLQHLAEDFRAGGDDVAGFEEAFVAHEVADQRAGFLRGIEKVGGFSGKSGVLAESMEAM